MILHALDHELYITVVFSASHLLVTVHLDLICLKYSCASLESRLWRYISCLGVVKVFVSPGTSFSDYSLHLSSLIFHALGVAELIGRFLPVGLRTTLRHWAQMLSSFFTSSLIFCDSFVIAVFFTQWRLTSCTEHSSEVQWRVPLPNAWYKQAINSTVQVTPF